MSVTAKIRVNFYDTDAMEVVHHANYIRWFEIGRVEYLRSIGITLGDLMADGFVFPITDVSAQFKSPGYYDDDLLIVTTAVKLSKIKMVFDYEVYRESDMTLLVTGHTQNVYTNRQTGKVARLSEKYYTKLEAAMKKELEEKNA